MRSRLKQFLFHISLLSHRPPSPPHTPDHELEKQIRMHWLRGLHSNGVGVTPPLSLHRAAIWWEKEQKLHYHLFLV